MLRLTVCTEGRLPAALAPQAGVSVALARLAHDADDLVLLGGAAWLKCFLNCLREADQAVTDLLLQTL